MTTLVGDDEYDARVNGGQRERWITIIIITTTTTTTVDVVVDEIEREGDRERGGERKRKLDEKKRDDSFNRQVTSNTRRY